MDFHMGSLYWRTTVEKGLPPFRQPVPAAYYDIAIVGGGISGALCAYILSQEGLQVALIEEKEIGHGSTSANTGLLQYSNDIMLHELMEQIGNDPAVRFYKACEAAIGQLEIVAASLPLDVQFRSRSSLYYASTEDDVPRLRKEWQALRQYGFSAEYWTPAEVESAFPFSKAGAIITHGDAEVNPLRLCRGAVRYAEEQGVHIYENTRVLEIHSPKEEVRLETTNGEMRAGKVVFTTGYTTFPCLDHGKEKLNRTFAMATKPMEDVSTWKERMMIWETERPYLYTRLTEDDRIIIGGLDEEISSLLHNRSVLHSKGEQLKRKLEDLFPEMPIEIDHIWAAMFGESTDNLPLIGRHPKFPRLLYLIGLGGNGTVYSMLGARLIRDLLAGIPNDLTDIVRLDR
ncbi:FAD-dependent oxidoreductase [Sporosarcina sp. FSL W7-1349]|uniref:NAD(P)/FAD-dependent oxidoreductase n=1 Tax=Sporosarcina sp. FSL W7-1349 TaxID=2921561 RepID=UPI0030F9BF21